MACLRCCPSPTASRRPLNGSEPSVRRWCVSGAADVVVSVLCAPALPVSAHLLGTPSFIRLVCDLYLPSTSPWCPGCHALSALWLSQRSALVVNRDELLHFRWASLSSQCLATGAKCSASKRAQCFCRPGASVARKPLRSLARWAACAAFSGRAQTQLALSQGT